MECEVALPVCRYIAFLLEAATPSRKAIPYEKNRCGGFFVDSLLMIFYLQREVVSGSL
ncbi:hypothetical protein VCHE25_0872 [Vibrio cholerae HE-25]|nr:hypothetical protein VCHE25_0872 [Vibrio cholerae HE-25]